MRPDDTPQTPMTLDEFMHLPDAVQRLVQILDGKLVPADPNDPEAQQIYQRTLAALAAGDITALRPE